MRLELDQTGERLDAAIARLVPGLSRSQAQRLLEEGLVTFEGNPLKKNEKSRAGMILDTSGSRRDGPAGAGHSARYPL